MSDPQPSILVLAAGGQLGRLVVDHLLDTVPAARVIAGVRTAEAGQPFSARGVAVRVADYDRPDTLRAALAGVGRVLLISSSALGRRVAQHRNVIEAAGHAGVHFVAYTSVLRADTSPLSVADEHRDTEAALRASGLPVAVLRNGWYTENYTAALPAALARGTLLGSAGEGRVASAARADYAAAAAAVLLMAEPPAGEVYELAGDTAYTLGEMADEVARQSGKPVRYVDLPEADYRAALLAAGLPAPVAAVVAGSDALAPGGALFDDGGRLGALIGRPTTPMAASVAAALGRR